MIYEEELNLTKGIEHCEDILISIKDVSPKKKNSYFMRNNYSNYNFVLQVMGGRPLRIVTLLSKFFHPSHDKVYIYYMYLLV